MRLEHITVAETKPRQSCAVVAEQFLPFLDEPHIAPSLDLGC